MISHERIKQWFWRVIDHNIWKTEDNQEIEDFKSNLDSFKAYDYETKTMKLAIVILLVLAAVGMGSAGICYNSHCSIRTVYFYPQCCPYNLHYAYVRFCHTAWHYCGRKRSAALPKNQVEVGFPCDFNEYDLNKDGSISKEELKKATNLSSQNVDIIFKHLDKNGDGKITCDELKKSRLEFKCKLVGCDQTSDEPWNIE
ncbi:uncharacterized protein LOC114533449 [Dendronephthya gigantea]|uniref:uncharacterized protein LOC114533449 n=1 Tax=Dendronephthya gigantea TaxID=151771 RepID=UPI00106DB1DE|nr:uncharacterized protein LOC114533449 [Dendronephthya gigantea]